MLSFIEVLYLYDYDWYNMSMVHTLIQSCRAMDQLHCKTQNSIELYQISQLLKCTWIRFDSSSWNMCRPSEMQLTASATIIIGMQELMVLLLWKYSLHCYNLMCVLMLTILRNLTSLVLTCRALLHSLLIITKLQSGLNNCTCYISPRTPLFSSHSN